jgi:hypothetical protein
VLHAQGTDELQIVDQIRSTVAAQCLDIGRAFQSLDGIDP